MIALLVAVPPASAPAPAPASPSMGLLLHLAEFGDAEDRYLDPTELEAAGPEQTRPESGTTTPQADAQDDATDDEDA